MNGVGTMQLVQSVCWRGVQSAVPLVLAGLGELIGERAGLINLGIEGTMLCGAFAGVAAAWWTTSAGLGVLAAMLCGGLIGLLFGGWTVLAKRDQIVTGLGVNLLAIGLTGAAVQRLDAWCASHGQAFVAPRLFSESRIDGLMIAAIVLVVLVHLFIRQTRPGLALRAVGENPQAADATGIHVTRVRMTAAIVGGMLSGAAGAYLSLGITTRFQEEMTAGRGYLALALVIFGRWSAPALAAAALFVGGVDALQVALQPELGARIHLLHPALLALPYLLTLLALAGLGTRARPPAALGTAYSRDD